MSRSRDSGEIAAPQHPTQRGAALPLTRMHPLFRAPVCGSQPPRRPIPLAFLPPASHLPAALSDAWPCWAVGWGWGGCPSAARLGTRVTRGPRERSPSRKRGHGLCHGSDIARQGAVHTPIPPRGRARARGARGGGARGRARTRARAERRSWERGVSCLVRAMRRAGPFYRNVWLYVQRCVTVHACISRDSAPCSAPRAPPRGPRVLGPP